MKFEIKQCVGSIEGWSDASAFGLFIDGFIISAFTRGDVFESNIDTILGKGTSNLNVTMNINYELSVKTQQRTPKNEVYDLFFNGLHVSRFTKDSNVYQNVLRFFDLKPVK